MSYSKYECEKYLKKYLWFKNNVLKEDFIQQGNEMHATILRKKSELKENLIKFYSIEKSLCFISFKPIVKLGD